MVVGVGFFMLMGVTWRRAGLESGEVEPAQQPNFCHRVGFQLMISLSARLIFVFLGRNLVLVVMDLGMCDGYS